MAGRKPVAEGGKSTPWTLSDPVVQAQVDRALALGVQPASISRLLGLHITAVSVYQARKKEFGIALLSAVADSIETIGRHDDWRARDRHLQLVIPEQAVPAEQVRAEIVKLANQAGLKVTDAAEALREITALVASRSSETAEPEAGEATGQD